ncbi:PIN domain-containing protein [Cupriavidus sp. CuC1]|uniref:PIN domain-containing protein n=1 Tax=Cupriavidus sp. CuC1 TaxID=3373131 RepID=UPI0037D3F79D
MAGPIILVDLENIPQFDLATIPVAARLIVFAGANQKSISLDLVIAGQGLEPPMRWIRACGAGKNALDFHIAFELGRLSERGECGPVYVLSKDKDYDPLIAHVVTTGMACWRVESLANIAPPTPKNNVPAVRQDSAPDIDIGAAFAATIKVREILSRSPKNVRPRKRETLIKHIRAMQQLKLTDQGISDVVDELLSSKLIVETNGQLSYHF